MAAHGWSSVRLGFVVCGYLAFFCGEIVQQAEAGCRERESPNCCTGRNNECFEYTKRKTVCYCDTYCQKTRDCCEDYQHVCQISGELLVSPCSPKCDITWFWNFWSFESSKFGGNEQVFQIHLCPVQWRLLFIVVRFEAEVAGSEVTRRQWDILHIAVSNVPIKAVCFEWPDWGGH